MVDLDAQIKAGLALEREGTEQQAIDHFRQLITQYPNHAQVQFEMGGAYDYAGYEAEAVPYYRRAIELGLPDELLPRVAVQLGSSLRNIGQYEGAVRVLSEAYTRFPEHRALGAFLALAQHSAGKNQPALVTLLDILLQDPAALNGYQRALRYYTDELK